MTKAEKQHEIIKYLLDEQFVKFNKPTMDKILEIDKDFDFNLFKMDKLAISILYRRDDIYDYQEKRHIKLDDLKLSALNTKNCHTESITNLTGFKIKGSDKIYNDLNVFAKNLENVFKLYQERWYWKDQSRDIVEYNVKFLKSKKNIKTIRFVFHSYTKKAHTIKKDKIWDKLNDYYVNGNPISYDLWLKYSREYKLKRILDD
jgi:hypothetical protein